MFFHINRILVRFGVHIWDRKCLNELAPFRYVSLCFGHLSSHYVISGSGINLKTSHLLGLDVKSDHHHSRKGLF